MRRVLIQCHKTNFTSAAFVTKLHTHRDLTQPDSPVYNVMKPGSWTRSVDFGTSVKGVVSATLLDRINGTAGFHTIWAQRFTLI